MLSLLLTEPTTIVADNTPDLGTQRFVSALNFLMNRDRDVLTSWLNSLSGQQPEIRGEVIRPELFEEGQEEGKSEKEKGKSGEAIQGKSEKEKGKSGEIIRAKLFKGGRS